MPKTPSPALAVAPATSSHQDYWDSFYAGRESADVPELPSPFAEWVAPRLQPGQRVVELGFGTGRDALWFADLGHRVTGLDFAPSAVARASEVAGRRGLDATFRVLDLCDAPAVESAARRISRTSGPRAVYGRFLVHSLQGDGRAHLFQLARRSLRDGGDLYLEFRTGRDLGARHEFGDDHYRVYLDPDVVAAEIEQYGGTVTHLEQGHGLAVYRTEDPHVARLVATFTR